MLFVLNNFKVKICFIFFFFVDSKVWEAERKSTVEKTKPCGRQTWAAIGPYMGVDPTFAYAPLIQRFKQIIIKKLKEIIIKLIENRK